MDSHYIRFLSAAKLLEWYFSGKFVDCGIPNNTAYHDLLLLARDARPNLPVHLHRAELHQTIGSDIGVDAGIIAAALLKSLDELSRPLLVIRRNKEIYAVRNRFESWQDLLSQMPPLPFIAYRYFARQHPKSSLLRALEHSTLPICLPVRPPQKEAELSFIDLHLHLNGTTEADFVWQYCLENLDKITNDFDEACRCPSVAMFYKQCHITSPSQLSNLIKLGRWLQESMARRLVCQWYKPKDYDMAQVMSQQLSMSTLKGFMDGGGASLLLSGYHNRTLRPEDRNGNRLMPHNGTMLHPLALLSRNPDFSLSSVQLEARLLYSVYQAITDGDRIFPLLLHCYFLTQCCVFRMAVHHKEQIGFDQFQYITNARLREHQEKASYDQRFKQLAGMYGPYLHHIEGRFSSKTDLSANLALLDKIENSYLNARSRPGQTLSLVAHFIKCEDDSSPRLCRHRKLRLTTEKKALALLETLKALQVGKHQASELNNIAIVGKDAAANELVTPPEVFAPAFARLKYHGLKRTTYHVGEDFRHLLSGLRAVDEALEFLDMEAGDRLGHATAVGFPPKLWQKRLGEYASLSQGEWLDNLVWLSETLQPHLGQKLQKKILKSIDSLVAKIYPNRTVDTGILFAAWKLRKHDPLYIERPEVEKAIARMRQSAAWSNPGAVCMSADIFEQTAIKELLQDIQKCQETFRLWRDYHQSNDVRKEYERDMRVSTDFIPDGLLCAAQEYLVAKINEKNVVVEVMPTSNKRISLYASFAEHHMVDWIAKEPPQKAPRFVICTDDPGIFATNLKNELAHFANALPKQQRSSALSRVSAHADTSKFIRL